MQTNLRYRPAIIGGDPNYLPSAATLGASAGYSYANSNAAIEQVFYLGGQSNNAASGHGSSSPGQWAHPGLGGPKDVNITTYNYATNSYTQAPVHMESLNFYAGAGNGKSENLQDQKTYMWQSYFWNDRIVGTLGINDDEVKNRNTIYPVTGIPAEYVNGYAIPNLYKNEGPWSYIGGNTASTGVAQAPPALEPDRRRGGGRQPPGRVRPHHRADLQPRGQLQPAVAELHRLLRQLARQAAGQGEGLGLHHRDSGQQAVRARHLVRDLE